VLEVSKNGSILYEDFELRNEVTVTFPIEPESCPPVSFWGEVSTYISTAVRAVSFNTREVKAFEPSSLVVFETVSGSAPRLMPRTYTPIACESASGFQYNAHTLLSLFTAVPVRHPGKNDQSDGVHQQNMCPSRR
jgi:hypothetical protein